MAGTFKPAQTALTLLKTHPNVLQLRLRVKPNSPRLTGILSVSRDHIQLSVAGVPRDGEANKAVFELLSSTLGIRKTDMSLVKGEKMREKVVQIGFGDSDETGEEMVEILLGRLRGAVA